MFFRIRWKNHEIRNTIHISNKMEYETKRENIPFDLCLIDRMKWRIEQIKIKICTDYDVYDLSMTNRIHKDETWSHDNMARFTDEYGDDDKIEEGKREQKKKIKKEGKRKRNEKERIQAGQFHLIFMGTLLGCTRTTRMMSNNVKVCCIHTSTVTFYPALLPLPWTISMKLDEIYDFELTSNKRSSVYFF